MVKVSEIKDRDSLETWLLDRPEDEAKAFSISISHRAAMRVLPVYWEWVETTNSPIERNLTALPILRCNLISGVACKRSLPEISEDAYAAASVSAIGTATPIASDAAFAIQVATITDDAITAAVSVATAADVTAAIWEQVRNECAALQSGDLLPAAPLWHGGENPLQKEWDAVHQLTTKNQGNGLIYHGAINFDGAYNHGEGYGKTKSIDWSFWINWYQDALEGREPDWDMLYEIALIPDEDWEKGPVHINNEVIAGIVEKYRLLRDVQALRKELAAVRQTAIAPIGHNNPPEGIDTEAEVVTQTEIIWVALEEAEEELSKPEPSPSVLKRVGVKILGALEKALKYCAGLADVVLKKAAEEGGAALGKWGVRGLMAWLVVQEPHVATIAGKLIDFAKWLVI